MAYDANARTVVLFGGYDGSRRLDETWTWDGRAWTQHRAAVSPTTVNTTAMAYDAKTRRVLLFNHAGETWLWDGVRHSWEKQSPKASPPARVKLMMAADPATQTVVLFGGLGSGVRYRNDTWVWDGATRTWSEAAAATRPPGRTDGGMAYDPVNKKIVLFGGDGSKGLLGDTWTFNGLTRTWTEAHPTTSPSPRLGTMMSNDDARNQVVLFSGWRGLIEDPVMWRWNGSNWVPRSAGPTPRAYGSMAYDAARQQVVLFGGNWWRESVDPYCGFLCGAPRNDTWIYGLGTIRPSGG